MEWTEKAAVAVDTPVPHEPGTEQLVGEEKNPHPPQHSSDNTGWEESIRLSKT